MRRALAAAGLAFGLAACAGPAPATEPARDAAPPPASPTPRPSAAVAAKRTQAARLVLDALTPGAREIAIDVSWPAVSSTEPHPQELLAIGWLRASDLEGGGPTMKGVVDLFARMRVFDVRGLAAGGTVTLRVPDEPIALFAILDRERQFLPTLFGRGPADDAIAVAPLADVAPGAVGTGTPWKLALAAVPQRPAEPEACAGERFELLEIDGRGAEGLARGTKRRLCAWLPASYRKDAKRRYPVIYALPGLASTDVASLRGRDHFGEILDDLARTRKREAIIVGVDTRSPFGSSYFAQSALQGDWETFGAETMVKAVDAHFRTIARADARALVGHSTGGFDAVSLAMRHPEVFGAIGASSPDALDLSAWLWGADGKVEPTWLGWMRLEDAMGGIGQLTSYAAAWSPDAAAPHGYAWPVDLVTGARNPAAATAWLAASPRAWLDTEGGVARAKKLSGRIYVTCGQKDEARLFTPAERYMAALRAKGIDARWVPTELGHLGAKRERFEPLLAFVLDRLATK